jgi:FHA domain-containing protein
VKTRSDDSDISKEPDEQRTPSLSKGKGPKAKERKGKRAKTKESSNKKTEKGETRADEPKHSDVDLPDLRAAAPTLPEPSPAQATLTEPFIKDEGVIEPEEAKPFYVIGGVESKTDTEAGTLDKPEIIAPEVSPSPPSSSQSSATGQGTYSIVFVNTPAQDLVKSKVQIDFDTFPTVAIGRGPENVVVIPDENVSRFHAELSMDGDRVMLKDHQSTNGTYLYDGKEFQQVKDNVEVKPNSLVKFGTSTIVKLTCD